MVDVVATPARAGSYVEWGAVFAGALAASAISFVLLTAGASIGLSLISPYAGESYSKTAASVAVFWSVAVPILSFLVGGYIAGRMRSAWEAAIVRRGAVPRRYAWHARLGAEHRRRRLAGVPRRRRGGQLKRAGRSRRA